MHKYQIVDIEFSSTQKFSAFCQLPIVLQYQSLAWGKRVNFKLFNLIYNMNKS